MSLFAAEPAFRHDAPEQIGVLIVNLGTPAAPTAGAVRAYLSEFLWDRRVVEIPRPLWWLILHGVILKTRPARSADKYATIWTADGSPLRLHTERQAKLLKGWLGQAGRSNLVVDFAMRYGEPALRAALDRLKAQRCERILVLPLYPQYAASTTASVQDEIALAVRQWRNVPEIRCLKSFHDDPGYIGALAASVREHWSVNGRGEKLIMSFHGVPRFALDRGDPYHCQCHKTARLLAEALGLTREHYMVTFQSRFGRTEWLRPYTQPSLQELARQGVSRVDLLCPGFVADCLETLEEIALEAKAAYLQSGGKSFHYIACLNERPDWIAALGKIAQANLGNWLADEAMSAQDLANRLARARALGANG